MYDKNLLKTVDIIVILLVAISLFIAYFWGILLLYDKFLLWVITHIEKIITARMAIAGIIILCVISIFVGKLIMVFTTKYYIRLIKWKKVIHIIDKDVREEIPVHLSEDYERESDKMEYLSYLQNLRKENEWNNFIRKGFEKRLTDT